MGHFSRFHALLLAAIILSAAMPASGATYYLSPSGDDQRGQGTRELPWKSIRHATDRVPDDGSTIVLLDGLYVAGHSVQRSFSKICTVTAETAYRARLQSPQNSNRAFSIYQGRNVVLRGVEIFGSGAASGEYLVHVSTAKTTRVAFIDCIIHDSYNNDLIKVNDGARNILFKGCLLFNQNDHGGDEHFDINTVTDVRVEDCILLNDFAGSGRPVKNEAHSFVVIKNSGSTPDVTRRIAVRRNIFLNWQGKPDQCYLLLGEDGKPFYEAQDVVIENNLFLHHSPIRSWGTLLLKGGLRNVVFRANTVSGHPNIKWSGALAAVCLRVGDNPPMEQLAFRNNIWSDASGQMPRFSISKGETFAEGALPLVSNNLYWNGGSEIPTEPSDTLVPTRDTQGIFEDPQLGDPGNDVVLPKWDMKAGQFVSGATTIREEFERLVERYAVPGRNSPAIDRAAPDAMPDDDILGNRRGDRPDIGCFEIGLPQDGNASRPLRSPENGSQSP